MLVPELSAMLATGVTVVTPNNRLARRLSALHDQAQMARGAGAWPAASVLPWSAWVFDLWRDLAGCAVDDEPVPALLSDIESTYLWQAVVAGSDAAVTPLFDIAGAASLAKNAWELMHAWSAGGESWRAWRTADAADGRTDQATFAQWAEAYQRELVRLTACDRSTLPDVLVRSAVQAAPLHDRRFAFAGFLESTPQQQRLQDALQRVGAAVANLAVSPSTNKRAVLADGATPRNELQRALTWAREFAVTHPSATVAIAVADLAQRREEVRTLAEEVLCPELQWPGQELAPRPYDISLGMPLAHTPLIATALDLLAIAHGPVAMADAAALLRSPYLPSTAARLRRAGLERTWLEEGRRTIRWNELGAALHPVDPELAQRFAAMREFASGQRLTMRNWVDAWRAWLAAAGWPGTGNGPLAHPEIAALGAWDELYSTLSRIDAVAPAQAGVHAVAQLRALAQMQIFQTEAASAPIAILGLLEAAALPVDALWVTGLNAETWPPAPMPTPLLPLSWQRDRNVPHSSAARELEYTRALTRALTQGAETVVLSYARSRDDYPSAPSQLALDQTDGNLPADAAVNSPSGPVLVLERRIDDTAPELPPGAHASGGAGLIAAQSDCPFRAAAKYRLRVDTWPNPVDGLLPRERGTLVHATLTHFFRGVGSHEKLTAMSPEQIDGGIAVAVAAACNAAKPIKPSRWALLPPAVVAGEPFRLHQLVHQWITNYELPRPPYTVIALETALPIGLRGLELSLQFDRVDRLPHGGVLMIDYKTGDVALPQHWFAQRPREPQLGLYTLTWQQHHPEVPVLGVAYAQLKPGKMRAIGISASPADWPLLLPVDIKSTGLASFDEAKAWWGQHLPQLAEDFRRGDAAVAPRDNGVPCRNCGLQSLCRISAMQDEFEDED